MAGVGIQRWTRGEATGLVGDGDGGGGGRGSNAQWLVRDG